MKSFNQLRNEIQEKMSKKDMKKLGVEDPLSGKGYPYQEDGVDERHAPLPKATGFAITYSYKGKDKLSTLCGGICTIILILFILLISYTEYEKIFHYKEYYTYQTKVFYNLK